MLLHPQLGLATKCHQEEGYFDYPTLPLEVVKRESRLAAMSENLRVLYVAMTHAKSQFISFASVRNLESRVKTSWPPICSRASPCLICAPNCNMTAIFS